MRIKRKIRTMALLVAFAVFTAFMAVNAEEALKIGLDGYHAKEGRLAVYVNQNMGDGFTPKIEDSTLLVGKQTVKIDEVKRFKDMNEPVSYLCIVDVSGSMDADRIEKIKVMLKDFVNNKGAKDNICVTKMGNELTSSGFLTDNVKLDEFISAIKVTTEDTNLYKGIKEQINVLMTDKAVNSKRCLVIFSDGADDQAVGITKAEADKIVADSHIPVYTVAMLKDKATQKQIEDAKILGSFSRSSAGGIHFAPVVDKTEYSQVYPGIKKSIDTSLVLMADISQIVVGDDNVVIKAELSDGTQKAQDSMTVPAGEIQKAIKEAKGNVNVTIIKDGEQQPEEAPKKNTGLMAAAAAGVICILILVLLMLRNKGKSSDTASGGDYYDSAVGEIGSSSSSYDGGMPAFDMGGSSPAPMPSKSVSVSSKSKCILSKLGKGDDKKYEFSMSGETSMGRNRKCNIVVENDTALSGTHCTFFVKNGHPYIKDMGSTNGTYVNGVPIVGEFELQKDDILLIGSAEYRIYWE